MNLLLSPEEYKVLHESSKQFEKEIDQILTEGFGDVIGSPIKYIKLKNNSKKYQKILVKKALNDLDYAKKKEKGSDTLDAKQKEVLTQANKAKNQALSDKASGISDRMSQLATNDGLKNVEILAKSKAKITAAETTMKAASGAESKALKIKIAKWKSDASDAKGVLADYEKEGGKDEKPSGDKTERLEARKEKIKVTIDKQKKKLEDLKDKKAEAEGDTRDEIEKEVEQIEDRIKDNEESMGKIDTEIAAAKGTKEPESKSDKTPSTKTGDEESDEEPKKEDMGEKERERLEKAEKILKGAQEAGDEEKIKKAEKTIKTLKDTVLKKEGKDPMQDLRNEINKRAVFSVNESVKDKFARLLNEKRSV